MPNCSQRFCATSDSAEHSHAVLFILAQCRFVRRVAYEDYKMRKTTEKMTRMTIGTGAGECVFYDVLALLIQVSKSLQSHAVLLAEILCNIGSRRTFTSRFVHPVALQITEEKTTRMTTRTSVNECLFSDVLTGLNLYNLMVYCSYRTMEGMQHRILHVCSSEAVPARTHDFLRGMEQSKGIDTELIYYT